MDFLVEHFCQFKVSVKHWFRGRASTDICNSCTFNEMSQSPAVPSPPILIPWPFKFCIIKKSDHARCK